MLTTLVAAVDRCLGIVRGTTAAPDEARAAPAPAPGAGAERR
ncbi:MAG: hypothetical protein U1F25_18810 [Rubrivivax sp.]